MYLKIYQTALKSKIMQNGKNCPYWYRKRIKQLVRFLKEQFRI